MGRRNNYFTNDFYCIKCGNKSLPLARRDSLKKEKFHRKKLYCYHCKEVCNHIECSSMEDVNEFLENFENGVYTDEAKNSLDHVRSSGIGQIDLFKKYDSKLKI